ncbi:MAG TPA: tetratricopeptide repeat protein, partial [Herpetosiphonaceae bacterium]
EAVRLARKHLMLWQAERSFQVAPLGFAQAEAARARQLDPQSALAPTLLARVELAQGRPDRADELLREAIRLLPAHPYAHLLRGDLLRAQGRLDEARAELRFETASREDLQGWARQRFSQTPLTATLDIGGGLDLGAIAGFYPAEEDGTRWTGERAELWLSAPAGTRVALRVAAQRPAGAPPAVLEALVNGEAAGSFPLAGDWQELELPIPAIGPEPALLRVDLRVRPWTPHAFDRFNPDGRDLGVRIDWAAIR